ncbi:hypothetical protein J7K93_02775 [bacterium]|nr:hypothetical protein [bacterium]
MCFKKIYSLAIVLILFDIYVSPLNAEWVSFNSGNKKRPQINVIKSNNTETVVEIILNGINLDKVEANGQIYYSLRFSNNKATSEIGKPRIPIISKMVGIPDMGSVKINIIEKDEEYFGNYKVYPYQGVIYEGQKKPFVIDKDFYQKDIKYPGEYTKVSDPMIWRDIRYILLKLYPVKYNPIKGNVTVCKRMVISLKYTKSGGKNTYTKNRKNIGKEWSKIYRKTIINYNYLDLIRNNSGNLYK